MSTVTVVATAEPSTGPGDPPRVRLDVTDTGSPAVTSVTLTRLNPDGRLVQVRTSDGAPLPLVTAGSDRVGLLYDYEAPLGTPVFYSSVESPDEGSAPVTLDESDVWLVHPGVPELSRPVDLRVGSFAEETLTVQRGVFYPMGRRRPVVQTDGSRKDGQSVMIVGTQSPDEEAAIRALVADAGILLLNVPADLALGVGAEYISVSDVRVARPSSIGTDARRDIELPYLVVDMPVGGSQAERTYADLLDFATYQSLRASYSSYLSLLSGP